MASFPLHLLSYVKTENIRNPVDYDDSGRNRMLPPNHLSNMRTLIMTIKISAALYIIVVYTVRSN